MSARARLSRSKRLEAWAIARLASPVIRALASTYRWRVEGAEHVEAVDASAKRPIMAFWHGRILPATYYFRNRGIVVITSENFDGEWIAGIITRFGYGTARGSTSRGGRRALLQLTRDMAAGRPAAFTLDGPRGPARVAQPGAVWLAKTTGSPLLPFHMEAAAHWTAGSWDATQIPKPFTTVGVAIGAPLFVPADADADGLEAARLALVRRLADLEGRARALVEGL